jgi:hypothetical protein
MDKLNLQEIDEMYRNNNWDDENFDSLAEIDYMKDMYEKGVETY